MTAVPDIAALRAELGAVVMRIAAIEAQLGGLPQLNRTVRSIRAATALAFNVADAQLVKPTRCRAVIPARFAAYWVANEVLDYSLVRIGQALGGRDHTTIKHGIERANEMRSSDAQFRRATDAIVAHVRKVHADA